MTGGRRGRVVALGCARSAGVTTTAATLACAWPARVLLAECDPAGGTLSARCGLPAEPGLVSLAAAARRRAEPGLIAEHCQTLPGGALVLAGPPSAEQARAALVMLGGRMRAGAGTGMDVIFDCGRLDPYSPVLDLFTSADLSLLVCRPQLSDLHALAGWLERHRESVPQLAVVLTGAGPYPAGEIADALGVPVLAGLPHDPAGAAQLAAAAGSRRRRSQSPFLRAAQALAGDVLGRLSAAPGTADTEPTTQPAAGPLNGIAAPAGRPQAVAAEPGLREGQFAGQVSGEW